ncbi:sugar nucleotide-binding protein [Acholeplasma manati]|uniref:dTDP-4-dehydrorhamnose reductase n=1 Tax=Paracholeplasma manati TaxID=591373 RepID=A0ABT2Y540_9MOLU|nr:sugar nucleotide-binding protein [Paracholeplasma manati]MCV2231859.1 sugar nucleotide-binding protein [Paracholeplasma manati]
MKVIITGMNGTVAPWIAKVYKSKGYEVVSFDRTKTNIDNEDAILKFIETQDPRVIIHCALGPVSWAESLARISRMLDITFVYTSTVSVYGNQQKGPFVVSDPVIPNDDYGTYKKQCEDACLAINPKSYILRLGWQIGYDEHNNQMLHYIHEKMKSEGVCKLSSRFYPSASFLEDTAQSIYAVVLNLPPDIYLLNSNHKYSLYEIGLYLKKQHPLIKIEEDLSFIYDNRMFDIRVPIKKLSELIG